MARSSPRSNRQHSGFTLVELLVSMAVLIVLMVVVLNVTNSLTSTVSRATVKLDAFASARSAFDLLNQKLSQATLNTYWDYDNPLSPTLYRRESDLQFLVVPNSQNPSYGQEVFFAAPASYSTQASITSTSGLLNGCSFFVRYGNDDHFRPATVTEKRHRYRLMQGLQPTEDLSIYGAKGSPGNTPPPRSILVTGQSVANPAWTTWWEQYWNLHAWTTKLGETDTSTGGAAAPLADNVITMIVWPRLSAADEPTGTKLTTDYTYDSKLDAYNDPQPITANQLPPTVQVTLVFISEASASRLNTNSDTPPKEIEDALKDRFAKVEDYQTDLDGLSDELSAKNIEFQIMNTSVPLRESKWSDDSQ